MTIDTADRRLAALRLIRAGLRLESHDAPPAPHTALCRHHRARSAELHRLLARARAHGSSGAAHAEDIAALGRLTDTCPDCQRHATGHRGMAFDIAGALGLLPDVPPARPGRGWDDAHDPRVTGRPRPDQTPGETR